MTEKEKIHIAAEKLYQAYGGETELENKWQTRIKHAILHTNTLRRLIMGDGGSRFIEGFGGLIYPTGW